MTTDIQTWFLQPSSTSTMCMHTHVGLYMCMHTHVGLYMHECAHAHLLPTVFFYSWNFTLAQAVLKFTVLLPQPLSARNASMHLSQIKKNDVTSFLKNKGKHTRWSSSAYMLNVWTCFDQRNPSGHGCHSPWEKQRERVCSRCRIDFLLHWCGPAWGMVHLSELPPLPLWSSTTHDRVITNNASR